MDSIWTKTAQPPQFDTLRSDLKTDVLIIGGGLAGVLCAYKLAQAGVNDILLSVDAFHQETIPLEPVKAFAQAVSVYDIRVRVHPAWVGSRREVNPYNIRTAKILVEFERMGFLQSEGNIVVPKGNALKYLGDYYDANQAYADPYEEDPRDIRTVCIDPDGSVLGGSINRESILEILKRYVPGDMTDTI